MPTRDEIDLARAALAITAGDWDNALHLLEVECASVPARGIWILRAAHRLEQELLFGGPP